MHPGVLDKLQYSSTNTKVKLEPLPDPTLDPGHTYPDPLYQSFFKVIDNWNNQYGLSGVAWVPLDESNPSGTGLAIFRNSSEKVFTGVITTGDVFEPNSHRTWF